MSEFFIPQHQKNKTRRTIYGYLLILTGVLSIVIKFGDEYGLRKLVSSVLALSSVWIGIDYLRGQKKFFIRIGDKKVEWLLDQNTSKVLFVVWSDIRWIKKEKDGGITFYLESSFSNYIPMHGLTKENANEILKEIGEMAMLRQIRVINFSEETVEVA